jgi:hypothetical protein
VKHFRPLLLLCFRTAKKRKDKRDQRAIDENKRLTVKMQAKARDRRARNRGKLSKEKQVSGDSSPGTLHINQMVERESIISCLLVLLLHIFLYYRELTVVVYLPCSLFSQPVDDEADTRFL